jgi:hypothetical protein
MVPKIWSETYFSSSRILLEFFMQIAKLWAKLIGPFLSQLPRLTAPWNVFFNIETLDKRVKYFWSKFLCPTLWYFCNPKLLQYCNFEEQEKLCFLPSWNAAECVCYFSTEESCLKLRSLLCCRDERLLRNAAFIAMPQWSPYRLSSHYWRYSSSWSEVEWRNTMRHRRWNTSPANPSRGEQVSRTIYAEHPSLALIVHCSW